MSYTAGTDLGRLREMVGDTSPDAEVFSDAYLNDLLDRYDDVSSAAVVALRRLMLDPALIRKKYRGMGTLSFNTLTNFQRVIEETIQHIERQGQGALREASSSDSAFPGDSNADETDVGRSTDSAGWWEPSDLDNYLSQVENRH